MVFGGVGRWGSKFGCLPAINIMIPGYQYSSKMKYSTQIETKPRKTREVRESEPSWIYANTHSQLRAGHISPSPLGHPPREAAPCNRGSRMSSRTQGSAERKLNPSNIEKLVSQLKSEYGMEGGSSRGPLSKVRSEQQLPPRVALTHPIEKYKQSMEELQEKLSLYSRNNHPDNAGSDRSPALVRSQRLPPAASTSNEKPSLSQKTQQCRALCLQIKRKLLKQTVSTTTSDLRRSISITDFKLGKLIGEGKFSRVFLARHIASGLVLAVKIIKKATIRRQNFSEQLSREIKIQSYFTHVNILKLYGCFHDQSNIYLLLEYCPGGQLYDLFKVKSKLSEAEWMPIMKGIAEALYQLHMHHVIHRDLKPENVVLAFGMPKIGDFGWSVYSRNDKRETFCGTPLYISPELLLGNHYDKAIDIWALGVMMYEFLTGKIPFKIEHEKNLLEIVNSQIVFPKSLGQNCLDLMKAMLNKDPHERIGILEVLEHPFLDRLSCNPKFRLTK